MEPCSFGAFIHPFNKYWITNHMLDIMLSAGDTEVMDTKY